MTSARVDLERILVRVDIHLDTREVTRQTGHGAVGAPVVGTILSTVDDVGIIIATAVGAAVAQNLGIAEARADLLWGTPEIVN